MTWYRKITDDLAALPDFITFYEAELIQAKAEVQITGNIEKNVAHLPGITEHRFNQLQDIEAVLNYLNIQLRKLKRKHFKKYLENYNRQLTPRDAEKYADGEDEVIDFEILINEVSLLRNRYLGILKGIDAKQWRLGDIVKLRVAGLEDAMIG